MPALINACGRSSRRRAYRGAFLFCQGVGSIQPTGVGGKETAARSFSVFLSQRVVSRRCGDDGVVRLSRLGRELFGSGGRVGSAQVHGNSVCISCALVRPETIRSSTSVSQGVIPTL